MLERLVPIEPFGLFRERPHLRDPLRDVLAAVAFLFAERMETSAYEALADADRDLLERILELVDLRRGR